MRVLLTGGAGYIGSHTAVELLNAGHEVIILDDFSNSSPVAVERIEQITDQSVTVIEADLADKNVATQALKNLEFDAVIHFAGLKAVGESVQEPTRYYRVNLNSTLNLLDIMSERGVTKLIFSSSATVYGEPTQIPISESHPVGTRISNPYGWSKAMNEQIIRDFAETQSNFSAVLLRYFNPIGAHHSGLIGEDPSGIPNNLMPFISQVAVGEREELSVFGQSYDTRDGTGERDYIHVVDLAHGHVAALAFNESGVQAFNLGTGVGTTVLEAVSAFEKANDVTVPYRVIEPRAGDLATVVADPTLAQQALNWEASRSFEDACRDTWAWQSANPRGYAS